MSDTSQGPGWWLASDGRWYPPHLAPSQQVAPTTYAPGWTTPWEPAASVSSGVATWLRIMFWVMAGVAGLTAVLALISALTYQAFRNDLTKDSYDTWRVAEGFLAVDNLLWFAASITLLVALIIWSWQAHRTVTALGAHLTWRIGWTIGAWFIPCAAIVLVKMVTGAIERAALSPRHAGGPGRPPRRLTLGAALPRRR